MRNPFRLILLTIILFMPRRLLAQEDTQFWFVAPYVANEGRGFDQPIYLRMATYASAATVTVSMPADPTFTPIVSNIPANSALSLDLTAFLNQLENSPANTVLNKGILIKSTADITAYYEELSEYDPEAYALKGKNALGTEFYISSQSTYDESNAYSSTNGFDIVATQNNTHVTITPTQPITGHAANVPFTVTLNLGQTYSAIATSILAGGHLGGSHVTSDEPIAITLKDDLVQISSCADLIGEQTVPTSVIGTDYIVTRGLLQPYDSIYILATADNTAVYQDGNATPVATLSKGQTFTINLSNNSTFIHASNKIYVYQLTGNGCESGSAIIPKLDCTGSQSVTIIRGNGDTFAVMITTKTAYANSFTVNGNATLVTGAAFTPVPGTGGAYVSAQIDLSNSTTVGTPINFSNSTGNFSLGFINGGTNDGTSYGYFSDFKSINVQNSQLSVCQGDSTQLSAYGGVTYRWSPAAGLSNPNIANPKASPAASTNYKVVIASAEGCVDSAYVNVVVLTAKKVDTTVTLCSGSSYKLPSGKVVNTTGTYNDTVRYAAGCDSLVTTLHLTLGSVTPAITISANQNDQCAGTQITFTAVPANGGTSPVYQWQVNGKNAGANSTTFTSSTLVTGDKVTCVLTSNATCATPANVTSNTVTMTVINAASPTVSIAASENNICSGTQVTFTATPFFGGNAPAYQWQLNGVNVGSNSTTYSSSTLANGDQVTCIMTGDLQCAVSGGTVSNIITVNVTTPVTPTVSIAASQTTICPGSTVTFTATPVNGGTSPSYQWFVNGNSAGTNSETFTSNTLSNGDVASCKLKSDAVCLVTANAISNNISITVNAAVSASVSIAVSQNDICQGTPVTFTATPTNGGAAPVYQWLVNGSEAGSNGDTFTISTLANNDKVTCVLTSNVQCAAPATSNAITMVVNSTVSPSVSITTSASSFCQGTTVTFIATPVSGGANPTYQWQLNGSNVGTGSSYISSSLNTGDQVSCILTGNAPCSTPATAASNTITVTVNPLVTPTVSISASQASICPNSPVTFTAAPVNGGASPSYQWLVDGNDAGVNSPTFTSSTLTNNQAISCRITSDAACLTAAVATSNTINIIVNSPVAPAVSIAISENNVCAGTPVTFTATPANGGVAPAYQWQVNGNNISGSTGDSFTVSTLVNGDAVSCIMTSDADCIVPASANSNSITANIFPLPVVDAGPDKTIKQGDTTKLAATSTGNIASITWSPATGLSNTSILNPTAAPFTTTTYKVTVLTTDGCTASASVTVNVNEPITIPNTFTPNGDGINDTWDLKNLKDYTNCQVQIFNRWGNEVFNSHGYAKPWDGTLNGKRLPIGTYYYVINLNNNTPPLAGFVLIIR